MSKWGGTHWEIRIVTDCFPAVTSTTTFTFPKIINSGETDFLEVKLTVYIDDNASPLGSSKTYKELDGTYECEGAEACPTWDLSQHS